MGCKGYDNRKLSMLTEEELDKSILYCKTCYSDCLTEKSQKYCQKYANSERHAELKKARLLANQKTKNKNALAAVTAFQTKYNGNSNYYPTVPTTIPS